MRDRDTMQSQITTKRENIDIFGKARENPEKGRSRPKTTREKSGAEFREEIEAYKSCAAYDLLPHLTQSSTS